MNNRVPLFALAILVAAALIATTIVTHAPTWEIVYVTFVAVLISAYALYWLLRGDNGHG
jgi:Na+-translocating ferredoxin:NAD+ oxidoreductase RnfD subunit